MRRLSSLKVTPIHPFGSSSNKMSSSLSRSSTYTVPSDSQNGMFHNFLFLSRIYIGYIYRFNKVFSSCGRSGSCPFFLVSAAFPPFGPCILLKISDRHVFEKSIY